MPQFYKEQQVLQQQEINTILNQQHKLLQQVKKVKRKLQHNLHAVSKGKIEQFSAKQIHSTIKVLNHNNFSEQLHDGRKMLKHFLYNRKIIRGAVAADMHLNFDDIDAMQQVIGDWHDNKLAIDFFNEKLPLENLSLMQQKQEELKEKVITQTNAFIKSVKSLNKH